MNIKTHTSVFQFFSLLILMIVVFFSIPPLQFLEAYSEQQSQYNLLAKLQVDEGNGKSRNAFGRGVAFNGNVLVVSASGSIRETSRDNADQRGVVYVYKKPQNGWNYAPPDAKLISSDGSFLSQMGISIAIQNDLIIAGAYQQDVRDSLEGAVYLFTRPSVGWQGTITETAKLIASDGLSNENLGYDIAIDGDTIVASSDAKVNGNNYQGAVYVFVRPAQGWNGVIRESAKLIASDGETGDRVSGLAMKGDTVVFRTKKGLYVFQKPDGGWSGTLKQPVKLTTSDDTMFGELSISNSAILVGKYLYVKPTSGYANSQETVKIIPQEGVVSNFYGTATKFSNDDTRIIIGSAITNNLTGAAYIFEKKGDNWSNFSQIGVITTTDGYVASAVFGSDGEVILGKFSSYLLSDPPGSALIYKKTTSSSQSTYKKYLPLIRASPKKAK